MKIKFLLIDEKQNRFCWIKGSNSVRIIQAKNVDNMHLWPKLVSELLSLSEVSPQLKENKQRQNLWCPLLLPRNYRQKALHKYGPFANTLDEKP